MNTFVDPHLRGAVYALKIWVEAAPAELARIAAVVELAVDNEGDDLWAAIDDDRDVMEFVRLEHSRIGCPSILSTAVAERDFDSLLIRYSYGKTPAIRSSIVEQDLSGLHPRPKLQGESVADIFGPVIH